MQMKKVNYYAQSAICELVMRTACSNVNKHKQTEANRNLVQKSQINLCALYLHNPRKRLNEDSKYLIKIFVRSEETQFHWKVARETKFYKSKHSGQIFKD